MSNDIALQDFCLLLFVLHMTLQQLILFACPESLTTTRRSHFPCCRYFADMQLILFACLLATTRARRHLCDDLTLPNCANGDKADYNPTGENRCHKRKWKCLVALVPFCYICWYHFQASPLYWWLHSNMLWRLWPNCEQKHLKKIPWNFIRCTLFFLFLYLTWIIRWGTTSVLERRNSAPRDRERRFVSLFFISSLISKRSCMTFGFL